MIAGIITVSDRCSRGEREDLSGKVLRDLIEENLSPTEVHYRLVPDELEAVRNALIELSDSCGCDLVLTTGGTGFSHRDVTPEATLEVLHKRAPGIPEVLRSLSSKKTPYAMLSRSEAGIRNHTLIVNFPGSPKGVSECFEILLPVLHHAMEILSGRSTDCGRHNDHS